ncbi:MAG TPA: type II toxin-antitoxin system VapC family toxin [Methylomirabilota bacterium]|nr:type II toxin-antitoxin system VapC family toxin [Methylomirabilota bacterium]
MYLDSCILVKLLVVEPDSGFFMRALVGRTLSTSELAYTEVFSALLARERSGSLSAADRRLAWKEFGSRLETGEIRMEPLNSVVLRKAVQLLERCQPEVPLRTLDAIHLATADLCQDFPLVTTDVRMRDAGQLMSLDLFPPGAGAPAN